MANPTKYDYNPEFYDYDEENGIISHFDDEGGTEAFDAETGEPIYRDDN